MKNKFSILSEKISFSLLVLYMLAFIDLQAQPVRQNRMVKDVRHYKSGELLVQYHRALSAHAARSISSRLGAGVKHELNHQPINMGPLHLIRTRPGQSVAQAIDILRHNPNIAHVQPNFIYHISVVPNDPGYAMLWGLNNSSQTISSPVYATNNPGTIGLDIDAQTAWDTITDCTSTVVAVIDSGVNYLHEDLNANMASGTYSCPVGTGSNGCDFVGVGDADPMDAHGHGTHVAGTIGARGNNSTGVTGVCWQAKILAVRVMDATGAGTTADIIEGIYFAAGTGAGNGNAKVINMSLGGIGAFDAAYSTAVDFARTNDVLVVVAAGNADTDHSALSGVGAYPCDLTQDNILCVAAVDQAFIRASFSDYDTNATVASRNVDIGAPGTNINSTYLGTETILSDDFNTASALDWTTGGGWDYKACDLGFGPYAMLLTPITWCVGSTPANSLNNIVYKNFDLSAYSGATVEYLLYLDLTNNGDFWNVNYKAAGGDPFTGGAQLISVPGPVHTGGFFAIQHDIGNCTSATCTIGFQYVTDTIANSILDGVAIIDFTIIGKTTTTNSYKLLNGTSMAAPHVAGIATMLRARNPDFTYLDTWHAIADMGVLAAGMSGNTRTGRVANAAESLKYIPQTTNVVLNVP